MAKIETFETPTLEGGPDMSDKGDAATVQRYIYTLHYPRPKCGDTWIHSETNVECLVLGVGPSDNKGLSQLVLHDMDRGTQFTSTHVMSGGIYYPQGSKLDPRFGKYIPTGYGLGAKGLELILAQKVAPTLEVEAKSAPTPALPLKK